MRKRSTTVTISVVAAVAGTFTLAAGCGTDDKTAYCVNRHDRVVDNQNCDRVSSGHGGGGAYAWRLANSGRNVRAGSHLTSGSRVDPGNKSAMRNAGIKGGFGGTGRGGVGRGAGG